MRRHFLITVGTAVAVSLTMSAGAMARAGDRTVVETYPVATALCVKAHTAVLPTKLAPKSAQVIAACNTLENAFVPLVSTVDGAEAAYLSTVANQKALVAAACPRPVTDKAACLAARTTARTTDGTARMTLRTAVTTFQNAVETNRLAFWAAISALRASS